VEQSPIPEDFELMPTHAPSRASERFARAIVIHAMGFATWFAASPCRADGGTITGKVTNAETREPLPFANVAVMGTKLGAVALDDGAYRITQIPEGVYEISASYVGFATVRRTGISIESGKTVTIDLALSPSAVSLSEIRVFGDRSLVDVNSTSSMKTLSAADIKGLTIEPTLASLIGQEAGVTVKDGDIHIRGGRADETLILVDGVALKDATSGNSIANAVSAGSAAEVSVVKGGWDAKYGQAISGIVDVRVKEGTERFHGKVSYLADTIDGNEDLHQANLQIEGPNPLLTPLARLLGLDRARGATFHLDLSTELSNSYLPSIGDLGGKRARLETAYRGLLFGKSFDYGSFFRPSGDNNWRITAKTGWAPHPAHKLAFTYIKSLGFSGLFNSVDIGEINRNITNYPWSWSRRLDHHYTIAEDFYSLALQWRHTLSDEMYQTLRLKRSFNAVHRDVGGRLWSEYEVPYDQILDAEGLGDPYFQDTGDASEYRDRYSDLVGAEWELVHETEHHHIATGIESSYEDLQYFSLDAYSVSPTEPLGKEFDLFHVYPTKINLFAQDRIEFPGINLKVGLRADTFFPGEQAERLYREAKRPGFNEETTAEWNDNTHSLFGQRYKLRWSPRIAVSHPITEDSHLFVNYGRFTQWPTYFFLYAKTGGVSSEEFPRIGNPNLEPEVSAQYEFGAGHKFSDVLSLRTTVFFKDIYDYPTSIPIEIGSRSTRRQTFFIYRNLDYARSRGFEIEIQKRREKRTWFSASYSYSVATGKSSDPNSLKLVQALGGDARETDLEEQFMWWNRPHKLTFSGGYQADPEDAPPVLFGWPLPRDWRISTYWLFQTGEAYTPSSPTGATIAKDYSSNGPVDSVVDVDFAKNLRVGGRKFELSVTARNLFNHRTVLQVDAATGFTPRPGLGSYWRDVQNPQTLFLNHALAQETTADAASFTSENNSVRRTLTDAINPAYVAAPRSVRLGISYVW